MDPRWRLMAWGQLVLLALGCADSSGNEASEMNGSLDGTVIEVYDAEVDSALVDVTVDAESDSGIHTRSLPVTESGPYRVGFRVLSTSYENPLDGSQRTLRTVVWYPTNQRSTRGALYMREVFFRPEVEEDAPPIENGQFPVMIFSHGSVAIAEQSYFLTEFLASHGWMVIAPDHEGNTIFDVASPPETYFLRPLDLTAALDGFEALPADDPLAGRMGDTTVVCGHSFGGYSTLTLAGAQFSVPWIRDACANGERPRSECDVLLQPQILELFERGFYDPRIDLAIPITPPSVGAYLDGGLAAIDVPVLLMTARRDQTLPNAMNGDLIAQDLDGVDDLHLDFNEAGHFTFSNLCDLLPEVSVGDGCGDGFADPVVFQRAVNAYILAFVRNRLWGDDSAESILTGADDLGVRLNSSEW